MGGNGAGSYGETGVQGIGISRTCYRYKAKLDAENVVIADWLLRLTDNQRNWALAVLSVPA
jgi:hypothetical protein